MKLSAWAREQGISYRTAWRWFKAAQPPDPGRRDRPWTLPVPAEQAARGTILVAPVASEAGAAALYARAHGVPDGGGGGLGPERASPEAAAAVSDPAAQTIVVEHGDRRMRFRCEYVEAALQAQGRRLVVADPGEVKDDLVRHMVEVLTSLCARLYGGGTARSRARKALVAIEAPR